MLHLKLLMFLLIGFVVLFFAVILNFLANFFGVITWYEFLKNFKEVGFSLNFFSIIFLFVVYPFCLGLISYYSILFLNSFFN